MIARYCDSLLVVLLLLLMWHRFEPPPAPSPLLMQLYCHAVSSRIGLGKLSILPRVSDLGREEGGDCGGEKITLGFRTIYRLSVIFRMITY